MRFAGDGLQCEFKALLAGKKGPRLWREARVPRGSIAQGRAVLKESEIVKKHLMPDHEHMMIAIPPKYAASQVLEFFEDNSAIYLARVYGERRRNFGVQPSLAPRVFSLFFSSSYCPWDGTGDSGHSSG